MAQPLWISNVLANGSTTSTWNLLVAATLNDTVYAFAADSSTSGTAAGTKLWWLSGDSGAAGNPLNLNCGTLGTPVSTSGTGPLTGSFPYYGIVSAPVIDTITTDPVLYTTSACVTSTGIVHWYLNAIDVTNGAELLGGSGGAFGMPMSSTGFLAGNQLQRPALLLTHAKDGGGNLKTYLYAAFGSAIYEIGTGMQGYNGFVFGYQISYGSSVPSGVTAMAFNTQFNTTPSNTVTGSFPVASSATIGAGLAGTGPYTNPSCSTSGACYHGDNWVDLTNSTGHGGGVWMAGKGPSSDVAGNVFFAAGNGTFDCSTSSSCTSISSMLNYGSSAIELTEASVAPADFYTPYVNNFINDELGTFPSGHSGAATKVQALNRYDQDFGTAGVLLFATSIGTGTQGWAVSADKSGYVYTMPTLSSGPGSNGLGQFQSGDAGLTSGSFTTQSPFQLSRLPSTTSTSTTTCPYPTATDPKHFSGSDCDQIMELAYWNNGTNQYLFAWPEMETLIASKGTGTSGTVTNYSFSTTPIDPCAGAGVYCSNFPQAVYPGGNMAIAATGQTSATLWVSLINNNVTGLPGELRGYSINPSVSPFLKDIYDPTAQHNNAANCTGLPTLPSSFTPSSFAEPTLVNGMVFSPVFKARNSSGVINGGGILVYGTCP